MELQHYPEAIKAYVISVRNKELQDVKDAVGLGRLSDINEDKRKIYVTSLKNLQLCHFKMVSEAGHFLTLFDMCLLGPSAFGGHHVLPIIFSLLMFRTLTQLKLISFLQGIKNYKM